jgi:F-type H+-transporting ATPase subunit gamma
MTATLDTLERQIRSAEDLASVVRTMKTLAAVSIRQYEDAVESLRDYRRTVEDGLRMLLWDSPSAAVAPDDPRQSAGTRELAVVFGSDQGMCGQFNQQIVSFVGERFRTASTVTRPRPIVIAVGHRCAGLLEEAGFGVEAVLTEASSASAVIDCVQELLSEIERVRSKLQPDRVALYFSWRTTAAQTEPHRTRVLPVDLRHFAGHWKSHRQSRSVPLHTIPRAALLASLLREHLFVSLFRACAESLSSENANRIQSMQSAERNIHDRLQELRREYHQSRQTSITEELLDVISGFEVLNRRERQTANQQQ